MWLLAYLYHIYRNDFGCRKTLNILKKYFIFPPPAITSHPVNQAITDLYIS